MSRSTRLVLAVILAGAAFRLAVGATLGLGVDESYTVANTRAFSLSFIDHPPLAFWLGGAAAKLFGSEAPLAVRLPFIALFAGSTWLIYRLGAHLFGAAAGAWAAVILNLAPFFAVAAGGWVVPDGPLDFFLLATALLLARIFFPAEGGLPPGGRAWRLWLGAGLCLGLAMLCKYHAVLFAAGVLLFVLLSPRHRFWLARPEPYAAGLLALALFLPVIVWNAEHGWVSFLFQGGRGRGEGGLHPGRVLAALAGQAAYLLPWTLVGLLALIGRGLTGRWLLPGERGEWRGSGGADRARFLACAALLPVAIFTIVPLWGPRGLPHWPMPGYLVAMPLLGVWAAAHARAARRWAVAGTVVLLLAAVIGVSHAATGWMARLAPAAFARGDPSLEAVEWSGLREALAARGWLGRKDLFIVSVQWLEAGKIDYALHGALPVLVFTQDPRHFAFRHDPADFLGMDAVIVGRARNMRNAAGDLAAYFERIEPLPPAWVGRGGAREIELPMLYAHRLIKPYPLPYGTPRAAGK